MRCKQNAPKGLHVRCRCKQNAFKRLHVYNRCKEKREKVYMFA